MMTHKNIEEVAERLQDVGIKALAFTVEQELNCIKAKPIGRLIAKVKENPRINIPIFGNGDIDSPEKALEYKNRYGVDGIMIGRAAIGYPWIFNEIKHFLETGEHLDPPTIEQRVEVIRKHLHRSVEWKGLIPGINEMRRHYTNYLKGLPNIKDYRTKLVTLPSAEEIDAVLDEIVKVYSGFKFERRLVQIESMAYSCSA